MAWKRLARRAELAAVHKKRYFLVSHVKDEIFTQNAEKEAPGGYKLLGLNQREVR